MGQAIPPTTIHASKQPQHGLATAPASRSPSLSSPLAGLAGDGRVLELATGTGRVALPLAARGTGVEGVDASAAMAERLRAKPAGESVPVTMGDMAEVPVSGRFRLAYLVLSTLFGLPQPATAGGVLRKRGAGARAGRDARHRVPRP